MPTPHLLSILLSVFSLLLTSSIASSLFDASTCGKSKQCFIPCIQPDICPTIASINFRNVTGTYYLDVELFSRELPQTSAHYMALGFADLDMMFNAPVSECSSIGDDPMTPKLSYNTDVENIRIPDLTQEVMNKVLTNFSLQSVNGEVLCRFTQQLNHLPFNNDMTYQYLDGDLKYLILAWGSTKDGGLSYHTKNGRDVSFLQLKVGRVFGVDCANGFDYVADKDLCVGSTWKYGYGWDLNEQACVNEGGTLVSIHDAFFNALLVSISSEKFGAGNRAMIGLQRNGTDPWSWADGSIVDYTKWASGEPSNGSNCAFLNPMDGYWYGGDCHSYNTVFLCQTKR